MPKAEGERLIAFEAAIQELGNLQLVAARYRPLQRDAQALLGELHDLGRTLRQAHRRGVFTDEVVEEAASRVRRLRREWQSHLMALRNSDLYRTALDAYAAGDQERLRAILPALFGGLRAEPYTATLYLPYPLTTHRRARGSPFRTPAAVAEDLTVLRRDGLRPRVHGNEWWDTDFPALSVTADLSAVDSPAVLALEQLPSDVALFGEGEGWAIFTPALHADFALVIAERSDDAWFEAAAGSYEEYRDGLVGELRRRGIEVRVSPAWS